MKIISLLISIGEASGIAIEYSHEEDYFVFSDPDTYDVFFSIEKDKFNEFIDALDNFREWL